MSDVPSEFSLISKYFGPLATAEAALGLTDDACLLKQKANCDLVVTTDALIAGVHFFADDPANLIAAKALRVNLSDLAAKGATPVGYLLALALPRTIENAWLECFARGLSEDQKEFGISLLGGDTTATPGPLMTAITALGHVPTGEMIRRSGAAPGDGVYVSGTIGDAGGGLEMLNGRADEGPEAAAAYLIGRYQVPTPRLDLGKALRGVASAALDVSDGLVADLGHIADVSKVRIIVDADHIPRSQALRQFWPGAEGLLKAATAGDDYEIAFTARSEADALAAGRKAGVPVTLIGQVEEGRGVALLDATGREISLTHAGYTHF